MRITLEIPDDLAAILAPPGQDPARTALEAIGLEAYRQRRMTGYQLRMLLGIPSRYELDGFLKAHEVEMYTIEDFEKDLATIRHIEEIRKAERRA
ncbi:conserved hypothetical protein [Candidatus Sulfopaludibacter sp. SbA4]|nr:conserved hypothetical protein [Candidatus Sulfopaludibacter sp. SbA4]